jgi:hypothetical protein
MHGFKKCAVRLQHILHILSQPIWWRLVALQVESSGIAGLANVVIPT